MAVGDLESLFALDEAAVRCPYPHYDAVREEEPVRYVPSIECWLVTRYADIVQVSRDPLTFSSIMPTGPVLARQQREAVEGLLAGDPELAARMVRMRGGTRVLLSADPPDHARQRRLVNRAFTPPKVRDLEPRIRQIANEMVDAFIDRGEVDLVPGYGVPLPLTIIAEALGVADDELPKFKKWSDDFVALIGNHDIGADELRAVLLSQIEFFEYFGAKIAERRVAPGTDLISDLVTATIDDAPLSDDEILAMLNQFLVAGNETTTKLIASSVRLLLDDPAQIDALRADPGLIPGFVEESLRLEPPVQGLYRTATVDTEIGGVPIKAGEHLMLVYAAGNRDEDKFVDAPTIDPCRPAVMSHLAFGHGEHFCVGSALARAEGRIALEVLLDRLDDLRYADGVEPGSLQYERSYVLHGLHALPIAFAARP